MDCSPDLLGASVKTFATLCVVLGILILLLYLVKRFVINRNSAADDRLIRMLSSFHVTPKARILLIEIMGEKLVIGVSQDNMQLLKKIDCAEDGFNGKRDSDGFSRDE